MEANLRLMAKKKSVNPELVVFGYSERKFLIYSLNHSAQINFNN